MFLVCGSNSESVNGFIVMKENMREIIRKYPLLNEVCMHHNIMDYDCLTAN